MKPKSPFPIWTFGLGYSFSECKQRRSHRKPTTVFQTLTWRRSTQYDEHSRFMCWPFSAPPRRLLEAQRGQGRGQGSSALCACSDPRRVHQGEGVAKAFSLKGWSRVQLSFLFCCDSAGFPPLLWLFRRAFQCSAHSCWGPLSEETSSQSRLMSKLPPAFHSL